MTPGEAVSTRRPFARSVELTALAIAAGAVALRVAFAPQFEGVDDAGYLDAALRVSHDQSLEQLFPLFRTRVGMAYPLGTLVSAGWLAPSQFWVLTVAADLVTVLALFVAGALLTGIPAAGLSAAALYAIYPLAVQQSATYSPTAFQVASIAVACALLAMAERSSSRPRWWCGFAAGVSLGIGYLFKEDVAIVVPAIAVASLIVRSPRVTTTAALCAGAALIFAIECLVYSMTTGNPLFRLTATSGLGAAVSGQLQIAEIWQWDAFIRSLLLLPVQVGVMWWLVMVALWFAWRQRRTAPRLAFVAVMFVVVMAYLQFGSGSFTTYAPLPKTPRYTALATPGLMLLTGAWLAMVFATRRRLAVAVSFAIVATALPCLVYLHLASSERTRNTLAVLPALNTIDEGTVYTDFYSARVLRLLAPGRDIRVWYHAKFDSHTMLLVNEPAPGSYVLFDRQSAKVYTSSYGLPLPAVVENHPRDWAPVWTHRAFPDGTFSRALLEGLHAAAMWLPSGNPLTSRIHRNIEDMIAGDQATLYRVPATAARSSH
jgi:hypothetical protein